MRQHSDPSRCDVARESGMPRKRSGGSETKGSAGITTMFGHVESVNGSEVDR
jgi:hypothetical protein